MNRKALIIAVVFLAAALVVPVVALYEIVTTNLRSYLEILPDLSDQTQINAYFASQAVKQNTLLTIVVIVEAVLVACFAISLWYALRCSRYDQCRTYPVPG